MDWFWWVIGHVPLTVWLVVTFVIVAVLYAFFGPIINAVLAITPRWVKVVLGGIFALVAAVAYGRYQGAKTEREIQKKREAGAVQKRKQINEKVHNLPDDRVDRELDRWMRD